MRKVLLLILSLVLLALPALAAANPQPPGPGRGERHRQEEQPGGDVLPASWYDHRDSHVKQRLEPINQPQWQEKFRGFRPYSWHGEPGREFVYHGKRINKAVFFFNNQDELVRIGFEFDGVFIIIKPDRGEERYHEDWLRNYP